MEGSEDAREGSGLSGRHNNGQPRYQRPRATMSAHIRGATDHVSSC